MRRKRRQLSSSYYGQSSYPSSNSYYGSSNYNPAGSYYGGSYPNTGYGGSSYYGSGMGQYGSGMGQYGSGMGQYGSGMGGQYGSSMGGQYGSSMGQYGTGLGQYGQYGQAYPNSNNNNSKRIAIRSRDHHPSFSVYGSGSMYPYGSGSNYQYPNLGSTYGSGQYGMSGYGNTGMNSQYGYSGQGNPWYRTSRTGAAGVQGRSGGAADAKVDGNPSAPVDKSGTGAGSSGK